MKLEIKNSNKFSNTLSQNISWGHWFTLFNILFVILLGSQYLIIADWPHTFMGRFYAILSCIGQFSFVCFVLYLITLFPLSFMIRSSRMITLIGTLIATIGITLILVDLAIFSRFRMHLNLTIWEILTTADNRALSREWQKLFIFVPFIFLLEILFALWIWKTLRGLTKRRRYAKPVVAVLILCFFSSHLIHIWADAHFYRPITMQRTSLPLSYPMTARHFLAKYGLISELKHHTRQLQTNPFALAIEYPLGQIQYQPLAKPHNLLVITIDALPSASIAAMPYLNQLASTHLFFENHHSASNRDSLSLFSLFYGLDANYYNSILASATPSALLDTIIKQKYSLAFFSTDDFRGAFYHKALLTNFSMPLPKNHSNQETTANWLTWFTELTKSTKDTPWFSLVHYQVTDAPTSANTNDTLSLQAYDTAIKRIDEQLKQLVDQLEEKKMMQNTVVIITAGKGLKVKNNNVDLMTKTHDFDRQLLNVPLVIAWPNKVGNKIQTPTTHVDIMRTLMEELLGVTTAPSNYSQGENLFHLPKKRHWLIAASDTNIAAIYPHLTVVIDNRAHYIIYDSKGQRECDAKLNAATFLELLISNRRFMVTD